MAYAVELPISDKPWKMLKIMNRIYLVNEDHCPYVIMNKSNDEFDIFPIHYSASAEKLMIPKEPNAKS